MQPYQSPLIAVSPSIRDVLVYVGKVAASDCTVLLTGETGTGKEMIAQLIHQQSARGAQPFVSINCAAVPESLFESELFGYERGAFTGANTSYPGKLKLAEGGTVLLDEIGEMPLSMQAKMLRVIEAREVSRLGGRHPEPINVRFIAATNQDLESLLVQQRFRADLFFRLNVARVHLPPLRERRGDIAELFMHYVGIMSRSSGREVAGISEQALACLLRYHWPGNVRELRNVVEAIFIDPPAHGITPADLPAPLASMAERATSDDDRERDRIIAALFATRWNKCRAAEELNCSRMTLYRKLTKYHISAPVRLPAP